MINKDWELRFVQKESVQQPQENHVFTGLSTRLSSSASSSSLPILLLLLLLPPHPAANAYCLPAPYG